MYSSRFGGASRGDGLMDDDGGASRGDGLMDDDGASRNDWLTRDGRGASCGGDWLTGDGRSRREGKRPVSDARALGGDDDELPEKLKKTRGSDDDDSPYSSPIRRRPAIPSSFVRVRLASRSLSVPATLQSGPPWATAAPSLRFILEDPVQHFGSAPPPGSPRLRPRATALGYFERLPRELFDTVFAYVDLASLGNLALASEPLRLIVLDWMSTNGWLSRCRVNLTRFLADPPPPAQKPKESVDVLAAAAPAQLAVLCKRVTCLTATRERIAFAFDVFDRCLQRSTLHAGNVVVKAKADWLRTSSAVLFFQLLHIYIRGWDESEFPQILKALDARYSLAEKLERLFRFPADEDVGLEMELRLVLRSLCWDFVGRDYGLRASWLLAVCQRYSRGSSRSQAMLFYLMFGVACADNAEHYTKDGDTAAGEDGTEPEMPLAQQNVMGLLYNHADWEHFTEVEPEDFHEGKSMFYVLAQAVCSCAEICGGGGGGEAAKCSMGVGGVRPSPKISLWEVLDALFEAPFMWTEANVAGFLLFCNEKVILEYVTSKMPALRPSMAEDDFASVARLLVQLIVVANRFDNALEAGKGVATILDATFRRVPTSGGGRCLLTAAMASRLELMMEESQTHAADDIPAIVSNFGEYVSGRAVAEEKAKLAAAGKQDLAHRAAAEKLVGLGDDCGGDGGGNEVEVSDDGDDMMACEE